MSDPTDIDRLHAKVAFLKMRAKPTNELLFIWAENDHSIWDKDDFDSCQKVLLERQVKLPDQQKEKYPPEENQPTPLELFQESLNQLAPFYRLNPTNDPVVADSLTRIFRVLFYIWFFGVLIGGVLTSNSNHNTRKFQEFLVDVTPADIVQIELHQFYDTRVKIDEPIIINDQVAIANFVLAIKKKQDFSWYPKPRENKIRVSIKVTNGQTVEFDCYSHKDDPKTLYVGSTKTKPFLFSWGEGRVLFPAPDFYNWLVNVGVEFDN